MAPYVPCYPTISGESLTRAVLTMEQTFTPHALAAALAGRRMAALDLETTGLDISSRWPGAAGGADRPTQVAVLPFTDGVLTGPALVELVDPCRPIGPVAQSLTGIGDADVAGAATWAAVLPRIVEAVGDRTVVVHNAVFDIEALRDMIDTVQDPARARELPAGTDAAALRARLDALGATSREWLPPGGLIDTRALSRAVFGPAGRGPDGQPRRAAGEPGDDRLGTLTSLFGIEHGGAHGARADALAAADVLYHLLAAGMWRGTVIDHHREQATYDRRAGGRGRPGSRPRAMSRDAAAATPAGAGDTVGDWPVWTVVGYYAETGQVYADHVAAPHPGTAVIAAAAAADDPDDLIVVCAVPGELAAWTPDGDDGYTVPAAALVAAAFDRLDPGSPGPPVGEGPAR